MNKLLLTTATLALFAVYPAFGAPMLSVTATDNGTALTFVPATNAPGDLTGSFTDPNFSQISVDLTGVPAVTSPDFGTVTLQVAGFSGTGTHTIDLIASQTGLTQPAGFNGMLTMTNNNLIGGPGPTVQTFSINGGSLNSFTFPASPASSATEIFADPNLAAITSETQEFKATFQTAGQDLEATQEFQAQAVGIPEPTSMTMLVSALAVMGLLGWRRRA